MSNKRNEIYTPAVRCTWANLIRPDEFRGSKKHTVQIEVTPELEDLIAQRFGVDKLNKDTVSGYLPAKGDYPAAVTVKTTQFTKDNIDRWAGTIVDSTGKAMEDYLPGSGDTVRLKVWVTEKEKLGLWLNGIQVVEATQASGGGGGSEGWEDMSDGDTVTTETSEDPPTQKEQETVVDTPSEDLPF
jgi:hypothetical protein